LESVEKRRRDFRHGFGEKRRNRGKWPSHARDRYGLEYLTQCAGPR
jgi:hypothetical protein